MGKTRVATENNSLLRLVVDLGTDESKRVLDVVLVLLLELVVRHLGPDEECSSPPREGLFDAETDAL